MENQNKLLTILEKLKNIFELLEFSQEKKRKLFAELIDSVFTLVMTKILTEKPELAEKIKTINMQKNISTDNVSSLTSSLDSDPSIKIMFNEELYKILSEYVVEVSTTVNDDKKQKIQEIWNFEKSSASAIAS